MKLFDTSVIIDARDPNAKHHNWARQTIASVAASVEGGGINPVVLAEASVKFAEPDKMPAVVQSWGLDLVPLPVASAVPAAKAFRIYLDRRKAEGKPLAEKMPLPDFLIGAHALATGEVLVTRDTGRVKTYFPEVQLETP